MGIGYKLSGCASCSRLSTELAQRPPNPDPKNYRIINLMQIGNFVIVRAVYPTCKDYEKNKILVFATKDHGYLKSCSLTQAEEKPSLDPHFCDSKEHPSPVARFQPGKEGLKMALFFCRNYWDKETE